MWALRVASLADLADLLALRYRSANRYRALLHHVVVRAHCAVAVLHLDRPAVATHPTVLYHRAALVRANRRALCCADVDGRMQRRCPCSIIRLEALARAKEGRHHAAGNRIDADLHPAAVLAHRRAAVGIVLPRLVCALPQIRLLVLAQAGQALHGRLRLCLTVIAVVVNLRVHGLQRHAVQRIHARRDVRLCVCHIRLGKPAVQFLALVYSLLILIGQRAQRKTAVLAQILIELVALDLLLVAGNVEWVACHGIRVGLEQDIPLLVRDPVIPAQDLRDVPSVVRSGALRPFAVDRCIILEPDEVRRVDMALGDVRPVLARLVVRLAHGGNDDIFRDLLPGLVVDRRRGQLVEHHIARLGRGANLLVVRALFVLKLRDAAGPAHKIAGIDIAPAAGLPVLALLVAHGRDQHIVSNGLLLAVRKRAVLHDLVQRHFQPRGVRAHPLVVRVLLVLQLAQPVVPADKLVDVQPVADRLARRVLPALTDVLAEQERIAVRVIRRQLVLSGNQKDLVNGRLLLRRQLVVVKQSKPLLFLDAELRVALGVLDALESAQAEHGLHRVVSVHAHLAAQLVERCGLLCGKPLEAAVNVLLRFLARPFAEDHRLRVVQRIHAINRELQDAVAVVVVGVAAARVYRRIALDRAPDRAAAERRHQIGQRLCKLLSDRLSLLLKCSVSAHAVPDRERIRKRALNRHTSTAEKATHKGKIFSSIDRNIRCYIPSCALLVVLLADAQRVRNDADGIERRITAGQLAVCEVEQIRRRENLGVRPCHRRNAFFALRLGHVLEQVGKLVVDLDLKHGKDLADGVCRIEYGRQRALGAVRHQSRCVSVRVRDRLVHAHALIDVLRVLRAVDRVCREMVDQLHRRAGQVAHPPPDRPVQPFRAVPVGQKGRGVAVSVVLAVRPHGLEHAAHQIGHGDLARRLRDRDDVRQPAPRVERNHIRGHAALQIFRHRVKLTVDRVLPAAVLAALLAGQVVRIAPQLGHEPAHAHALPVAQIVDQLLHTAAVIVVNLLDLLPLLQRVQLRVCADRIDLRLHALVRQRIAHLILQRAQLLDALCQRDHVCGRLNILVKARHRVIVRDLALALQQIAEPLFARPERVRQARDIRRHLQIAVLAHAQREPHTAEQRVRLVFHEMRRVILPERRGLLPVEQQRLVDLIVQLIVDTPELLHRAVDLGVHLGRDLDLVVLDVLGRRAVFGFQPHLHERTLVLVQSELLYALTHAVFELVALGDRLMHRRDILADDCLGLCLMLLAEDVADIALHGLALVG